VAASMVWPCRVAWSLANTSEDGDDVSYGLVRDAVAHVREHLSPVEVWAPEASGPSG